MQEHSPPPSRKGLLRGTGNNQTTNEISWNEAKYSHTASDSKITTTKLHEARGASARPARHSLKTLTQCHFQSNNSTQMAVLVLAIQMRIFSLRRWHMCAGGSQETLLHNISKTYRPVAIVCECPYYACSIKHKARPLPAGTSA